MSPRKALLFLQGTILHQILQHSVNTDLRKKNQQNKSRFARKKLFLFVEQQWLPVALTAANAKNIKPRGKIQISNVLKK